MRPRKIELTDLRSPRVPTRVSVPFDKNEVTDLSKLTVRDSTGKAVPTQGRSMLDWDDGSCKWGLFFFEPGADGGPFTLGEGANPVASLSLVRGDGDLHRVDTGKVVLEIPVARGCPQAVSYPPFLSSLTYRDASGALHPILRGTPHMGLRIEEKDGRVFLSERTIEIRMLRDERLRCRDRDVTVIESGPIRALILIRGITAVDIYSPGLDYVLQIEAYRNSSLVKLAVTWRHADREVYHHVRDIHFALPFAQRATKVITGLECGATTDVLFPGSTYRVLQEDEDRYYAERLDPSGGRAVLAWGSANDRHAPGWMQARFADARLSVALRDFVRECPNELRMDENEVSFGLWPADAAHSIAARRILPVHPESDRHPGVRHLHTVYDNLICHPYWAFFDKDSQCLETVRGMQKTQVMWCDADPAIDSIEWNRRVRGGALEVNPARLACADLRRSVLYADLRELDLTKRPEWANLLTGSATWLKNHEDAYHATGKFDAGDTKTWMNHSGAKEIVGKHGARREHSRAGYWVNNETDPCHALMMYFLATGDTGAYRRACQNAEHLWDIDVQHYPHFGVYTHGFGHCFRAYPPTATDHFWIEGLLDYYLLTGDPEVRRGISELALFLSGRDPSGHRPTRPLVHGSGTIDDIPKEPFDIKVSKVDLRTVSLLLRQLVRYSDFGERGVMLGMARELAEGLIVEQHPDGFFPNWGSHARREFAQKGTPGYIFPEKGVQGAWFSSLALEGLRELYLVDPNPRWREALYGQLGFLVDHCLFGEYSLVDDRARVDAKTVTNLPGLADRPYASLASWVLQSLFVFAYHDRKDEKYLELGRRMMRYFTAQPLCGPEWGKKLEGLPAPQTTHDDDGNEIPATPERNELRTGCATPSVTLTCLPPMMALLIEKDSEKA